MRRIGFEPRLEREALRRLSEIDVPGCRASYGKLLMKLDLDAQSVPVQRVRLLFADMLQRVNRRVHRGPADERAGLESREDLIRTFAHIRTSEDARRAFLPALDRLLGALTSRSRPSGRLVERAKAFIEENHHRKISLSVVAAKLNVSPNYLSRLFRRETGETLTAWVHQERMQHALVLLAEGGRSISEIAYLVGYQNYRDFYRNFVKYEQASPREVRRRLNGGS